MIGENSILHSLFLWCSLLATAILYSDCAAAPMEVKSELLIPAAAGKHSVAVIPDPYMDDLTTAKRLVDLVRAEMTQRGFRVSLSENTAELVIIPQLTSPASGETPAKPVNSLPSINLISPNIAEPGMMQNAERLGELPQWDSPPALPAEQIQLTILAVQLDVWRKALIINQLKVPQVWRISVFAPTYFCPKGREVTAEMVEAAGPQFAQLAKK
jgi:hypothetical protein